MREGGSDVAQTCNILMYHHPLATHMPAVSLYQSSATSAGHASLSQIAPAPPNRTVAHTVSQPQRDNRDIMRAGCDTKWVSEAAMAAGHGVE